MRIQDISPAIKSEIAKINERDSECRRQAIMRGLDIPEAELQAFNAGVQAYHDYLERRFGLSFMQ